jgi:hypothetical protein
MWSGSVEGARAHLAHMSKKAHLDLVTAKKTCVARPDTTTTLSYVHSVHCAR